MIIDSHIITRLVASTDRELDTNKITKYCKIKPRDLFGS